MIRNVEVIASKRVNTLTELKAVIARVEEMTDDHPDTIYLRADVALERETLSDGSFVHNIEIVGRN